MKRKKMVYLTPTQKEFMLNDFRNGKMTALEAAAKYNVTIGTFYRHNGAGNTPKVSKIRENLEAENTKLKSIIIELLLKG